MSVLAQDDVQELIENGLANLPPPDPGAPASSFDPYAAEVLTDPYDHYRRLRELGPVVWLRRYGAYAVCHYEPIRDILTDDATYGSSAGAGLTNFHTSKPWRTPSLLLETDRPEHDRTRKQMMRVMNPAAIRAFRQTFEALADQMVDDMIAKGQCDGTKDLAERFPLKAFCDAVGIPADGRENLLPYGDMVFNAFGPANTRFKECLASVSSSVVPWITHACKRDTLTEDGLGRRLFQGVESGDLTEDEAELLVRSLLSAGLDTTIFTLSIALVNLARHPDQWQTLKNKPSLARQAVEEILRYDSTFHSFYRTTRKPVELCGVKMDEEQKIMVLVASANRDPNYWDRPDTLDITRRAANHLAFGTGIHGCAGQMMARLEGEIVLTALANKLDKLELTGEPVLHFNNTVRGYMSSPLRVTGKP